jgi:hypothetical protein
MKFHNMEMDATQNEKYHSQYKILEYEMLYHNLKMLAKI